jgi:hypothetical protein
MPGIVQAVSSVVSAVGSIFTGIANSQAQSSAQSEQQRLNALQQPGAAAKAIESNEQPLSQGLTQGVGNEVQGYLAERGLSESPAIQASQLSQALGPYQLQEQQLAENATFSPYGISPPNQVLGQPRGVGTPFPGTYNSGQAPSGPDTVTGSGSGAFWGNPQVDTENVPLPAQIPDYNPSDLGLTAN